MNLHHGNTKLQIKFQFATSTKRFRADETFYVQEVEFWMLQVGMECYHLKF